MIPPAVDPWLLHQKFVDGSSKHKNLSALWSPYFGWEFIHLQTDERSVQELKKLCAIAALRLPQDGTRARWAVYLDDVRRHDPTKREGPYFIRQIRQKQIAADLKEVEDRQSQGAVPSLVEYVPYVRTVEASDDPESALVGLVLEEEFGPMYVCKLRTVRIDDIYGACAVHCLHLMTTGVSAPATAELPPAETEPAKGPPAAEPLTFGEWLRTHLKLLDITPYGLREFGGPTRPTTQRAFDDMPTRPSKKRKMVEAINTARNAKKLPSIQPSEKLMRD